MIMKKLTTWAAMLVAVAAMVTTSHALTANQVQEIKNTVLSVPVPEMPAKAVELVTNADKEDRQAVAITAVRAIVKKHRAAAPVVVAALSKAAPELAPVLALEASKLAPDQKTYIVRSASIAAPAQAGEIATVTAARTGAVATRGFGAQTPGSGTVTIGDTRINGEEFPTSDPNEAPEPVITYNTPPE